MATMMMTAMAKLAETMVAQEAAPATGGGSALDGVMGMLPLLLMFGVIYLLILRPASKQRKEHQQLLNELKKDDEVVTAAGFYGRIVALDDKVATLEIADKVKIRLLRDRIAGRWSENGSTSQK